MLEHLNHELRSPMTVIVGMTDLLLLHPQDGETTQCLHSVRNAADVLLRMLDEAVQFSRLQVGGVQLGKQQFSLVEVVGQARQELAKGVAPLKFEAQIDEKVPTILVGDPDRLRAVITALVRSAAKFRSAAVYQLRVGAEVGAEVVLHLALGNDGRPFDALRFDSGGGRFLSLQGFDDDGFCGSGLGLPVTAGIVELSGGRLWMADDASCPVLFHVTMRFAIANSERQTDLLAAVEERLDAQPSPGRSLRILLVEDTAANRRFYTSALEQRGHQVAAVANGKEALRAFEANGTESGIDLMLIDLEMPEMNGWQTAAALRALDAFRRRPVPMIALTAHATSGNPELARSALFNAAVTKAGEIAHFYCVVESLGQDGSPAGQTLDAAANNERRLDLEGTLKRLGGSRPLLLDLVRFFLEDAPVVLAELGTALERDDMKVAERAAHSLKGLVANFGAQEAIRLAAELQRLGHEGNLSEGRPLYQRLQTEVNLLRRELEAYQAGSAHTLPGRS